MRKFLRGSSALLAGAATIVSLAAMSGVSQASVRTAARPSTSRVAPAPARSPGARVPQAPATCHYSTNTSQGFTFDGVFFQGFGYAGHYSGTTVVPSTTQVTAAGVEAQCLLVRYGDYNPGPVDGVFGPNSQAALKQFQQDMNSLFGAGLTVDGSCGPHTWPWLRWFEQ